MSPLVVWPDDITTGEVTLDDLAPLAAFSYIGNETASSATPTAVKFNCVPGLTSTATAAGTTTLTNLSKGVQVFTGATTQTITLPDVTTLPQTGFGYQIINRSTGALTINSSGGNLVQTLGAGAETFLSAVLLTGTTAASWVTVAIPQVTTGGSVVIPYDSYIVNNATNVLGYSSGTGIFTLGFSGIQNNVGGNPLLLGDTVGTSVRSGFFRSVGGSRASANVTTVSITPAAITGLSATLIAGLTYSGVLVVMCSAATAADGFRVDFDGGAATATNFRAMGTIADTVSVRPLAMTSAIATDFVDTTTTGDAIATIYFTITVNAGGTFIPRYGKEADAAGATNTVYRGSYMDIIDIV